MLKYWFTIALSAVCAYPARQLAPSDTPIRCPHYPALSPDGSKICLSYQGNLWIVSSKGGDASRVTVADGYDSFPCWSPDGRWIAFNSTRGGSNQIYIMPANGGMPRQITYHSMGAVLGDWSPDGKSLAFHANRDGRGYNVYTVDIATGRSRRLTNDDLWTTAPRCSADGKWIIFQRGYEDHYRKGYRGSANYDIWAIPAAGGPFKRLTDWNGNDIWPRLTGKTLYYVSERGGHEATIWKQPFDTSAPKTAVPVEVVHNPPDAIRHLTISANGSMMAYECDHRIYAGPAAGGAPRPIEIICRTDLKTDPLEHAQLTSGVTDFDLTADGKKTVFAVHGELFSVFADKGGDARRLTETTVRESDVAWSSDGSRLAFVSHRDGEPNLYVMEVATKKTTRLTKTTERDEAPRWSPDGKTIAFIRTANEGGRLYTVPSDGSAAEKVLVPGPWVEDPQWSPDGKWIAYTAADEYLAEDIWVVPSEGGQPKNITKYPCSNDMPRWSPDGKKLAFRSDRTRNREREKYFEFGRYAIYTVSLEPDRDKPTDAEMEDEGPRPVQPAGAAAKAPVTVSVDFDDIENRARPLTGFDEGVREYAISPDSKTIVFGTTTAGQSELWSVSTDGGAVNRLGTGVGECKSLRWTPDSSRVFYLAGEAIHSVRIAGGAPSTLPFSARMDIDHAAECRVAFDEAWKELNDRFYDPTFHGKDWRAIGDKYRALLPWCAAREDFHFLLTEMFGELNASHMWVDLVNGPKYRETASIGIWQDDRYDGPGVKVAESIKNGPCDKVDSRVKAGEYILAVDGADASPGEPFDALLAGKVGRRIALLVNDKPMKEGARTVFVRGIGQIAWRNLVYERWVKQKRELTDKLSAGKVAYVHVRDMEDIARFRFERDLYTQSQGKQALVLDVRFNTGGNTHDALLRILSRNKPYFMFKPRGGRTFVQPERAWTKPTVLLINERSISDAEIFPNGFRALGLGKIVGQTTRGYVIFTNPYTLIDGTTIHRPFSACITLDGKDMENLGIQPDIRIENSPDDTAAGRDPQLERAVKEALAGK